MRQTDRLTESMTERQYRDRRTAEIDTKRQNTARNGGGGGGGGGGSEGELWQHRHLFAAVISIIRCPVS